MNMPRSKTTCGSSRRFSIKKKFFIVIGLIPFFVGCMAHAWVYPGTSWATQTPAAVGMDSTKLGTFSSYLGGRGIVVRHGYQVYTWNTVGTQSTRADIASACKPFYTHFMLDAVESGLLANPDVTVVTYAPCLNNLNSPGFKDRNTTFRHMVNQISCYGVSEAPGTRFDYNDYQSALLFDTLFLTLYGATYANVDAKVLGPNLTNILQCQDSPTFIPFGTGDRPGRVGTSVRDHARFAYLYLRKGNWNGNQILSQANVALATTTEVPNSIPRTAGVAAQMCPGQRTIGGTTIPDNQTDHYGSYSYYWWTNGVDSDGNRNWPNAPLDTYGAFGHVNGKRSCVVIPSLDIVVAWNDTTLDSKPEPDPQDEALKRLVAAVNYTGMTEVCQTARHSRLKSHCGKTIRN
jgi:CubicO group peptidase (beta-lactamase class C family)